MAREEHVYVYWDEHLKGHALYTAVCLLHRHYWLQLVCVCYIINQRGDYNI